MRQNAQSIKIYIYKSLEQNLLIICNGYKVHYRGNLNIFLFVKRSKGLCDSIYARSRVTMRLESSLTDEFIVAVWRKQQNYQLSLSRKDRHALKPTVAKNQPFNCFSKFRFHFTYLLLVVGYFQIYILYAYNFFQYPDEL